MTVDKGTSESVSQKQYPIAMKHYQWVKEEIKKLLTAKVIQGSRSSWSGPIIVVPKGDRGKRLVIDYHPLNKVTIKFTWPMPKVEDIFSKLNGANIFHWTYKQDTITFLWMNPPSQKQHSTHLSANTNMSNYLLD